MPDVSLIKARLAGYAAARVDLTGVARQAAVAVVLRPRVDDTDVLFIHRAVKPGDPWSGQMAFPGGHRDRADPHLRAAAERETFEELGLDLSTATYLGALDQQQASPRGRPISLIIEPHVYEVRGDPYLEPNFEVQSALWSSLRRLYSNRHHDAEVMHIGGAATVFNGYRLEGGHFVWGLTYRMLKSLFATIDPGWQPPAER